MRPSHEIVKRPLLTEKGTRLKESGGHSDKQLEDVAPEARCAKLMFEVARDANKVEIRHAIEKLFNVNVKSVRTQIVRGKEKRLGRWSGRRPHWKKAIVTLGAGQTIDFFEGA